MSDHATEPPPATPTEPCPLLCERCPAPAAPGAVLCALCAFDDEIDPYADDDAPDLIEVVTVEAFDATKHLLPPGSTLPLGYMVEREVEVDGGITLAITHLSPYGAAGQRDVYRIDGARDDGEEMGAATYLAEVLLEGDGEALWAEIDRIIDDEIIDDEIADAACAAAERAMGQ